MSCHLPGAAGSPSRRLADIVFDYVTPPTSHPNTLLLAAFDAEGARLAGETWLSVGGGFVVREGEALSDEGGKGYPFPFRDAADLLRVAEANSLTIAELMRRNEDAVSGEVDVRLDVLLDAMFACLDRGLKLEGQLPGGLKVQRRAKGIYDRLIAQRGRNVRAAHEIMDFVSVYAMAVNEENAAGGKVVTAPTNGAAGVVPSVLRYYRDHCSGGRGGSAGVPADGGGDRGAVQAQRFDLGRGSRLPGRGRRRLVDGGGGALRGARRRRMRRSRTPPRSRWSTISA